MQNNTVNILHLYSDMLDLYGDYWNVSAIEQALNQIGIEVNIDKKQLGDTLSFHEYDVVYIGHGKYKNLAAIREHFCSYKDDILKFIDDEKVFISIGNSRMLFGSCFYTKENPEQKFEGISLFDYTAIEKSQIITFDVFAHLAFMPKTRSYGFVNRTCDLVQNKPESSQEFPLNPSLYPLFVLRNSRGDGELKSTFEGNLYKNFFATFQIAPVLVKNPALLKEVVRRIARDNYKDFDCSLEEKALEIQFAI